MEVSGKFEAAPPRSIQRAFQKLFAKDHFNFPNAPKPDEVKKPQPEKRPPKEKAGIKTSFSRATGGKIRGGEYVLKEACEDHARAGKNLTGNIVAVVADGVSKSKNGGFMAETIVREVSHSRYADKNTLPSAIYRAWEWASLDRRGEGSASTVAALVVNPIERKVLTADAGDTSIYLLRGGRVYELTKKHNVYDDFLRSGGTPEEAKAKGLHKKKSRITKYIHAQSAYQRPDTKEERFLPGDLFVVASDGFEKGFRSKEDMLPFFEKAREEEYPATYLVNESLQRQMGKDYIDDIAVAVVQL